jgi:hypothetical protein
MSHVVLSSPYSYQVTFSRPPPPRPICNAFRFRSNPPITIHAPQPMVCCHLPMWAFFALVFFICAATNATWHCTVNAQSTGTGTPPVATPVPILPPATTLGSNKCQPWQMFLTPRIMPQGVPLCASNVQTCCDAGLARRTMVFALEDDGCGVVGAQCLAALMDLGCHVMCSTMTVPSAPTSFDKSRATVCRTWLQRAYTACYLESWCITTNGLTSSCTFLQTSTNKQRVSGSGGSSSSGTVSVTTTNEVADRSTCTLVSNLNPEEFGRNILSVAVSDSDCGNPISQPVMLAAAPSTQSNGASESFPIMTLLLGSVIVTACLLHWD